MWKLVYTELLVCICIYMTDGLAAMARVQPPDLPSPWGSGTPI